MMNIVVKTLKHDVQVELLYGYIRTSEVIVKKELFAKMCKDGCVNFGKKFSCPPVSPCFHSKKKYLLVIFMRVFLEQFDYKEYHKLRIGNAILKPRIDLVMRKLEDKFGGRYYSSGSCRLCKKCGKVCNHPEKMRFSLESTGVDCNQLVKDVFGLELKWYCAKKAPMYTAVVAGLPVDEKIIITSQSMDQIFEKNKV
jgi:predicted metal-binding protein